MGLNVHSTRLLLLAKRAGVDFSRTVTLGRQSLLLPRRDLAALVKSLGMADLVPNPDAAYSGSLYADNILRLLGCDSPESIDASAYEGATLIHDLNKPMGDRFRGKFSLVVDFGTLEHVFNFPVAIANCMAMLKVGGHLLVATPVNNYMGHGFYQFSPELYFRVLSRENGFAIEQMFLCEELRNAKWYSVADPVAVKQRVELTNSLKTHMLVRARKISDAEAFAASPQQSDYERDLWNRDRQESLVGNGVRWLDTLGAQLAPNWLKDWRRHVIRMMHHPFRSGSYAAVDKNDPGER